MVAGVTDGGLETFFRLLSDPKQLKDALDKFEVAKNGADEAVALVGPANEILQLRKQTAGLQKDAADSVIAAQKVADAIRIKVQAEAEHIVAQAKQEAEQRIAGVIVEEQRVAGLQVEAQTALADAQRMQFDAAAELQRVTESAQRLDTAHAEIATKQEELDRRIGQLEEARASLKLMLE
jgi:hypothetical protein